MLSDMPHRPRCQWCVTGRGRAVQPRRERGRGVPGVPFVAMDFSHVGELITAVLFAKCSVTGIGGAQAIESKEITPKQVEAFLKDIADMGDMGNTLQSGSEPPVKLLASRIKDMRIYPHHRRGVAEAQAMGQRTRGEVCVQTFKGMCVTSRSSLDHHIW